MKKYWLIGDPHGNYTIFHNFYQTHKDELSKNYEDNILIVLGDMGANYFLNNRDDFFKEKIHKYPLTYFCIRGNHEERPSNLMNKYPSDWHIETFCGNRVYVEDRFPKILYALDEGGEYQIANKSVLILPGAYSVDKWYRLSVGWSYFFDEQLTQSEMDALKNQLKPHYDFILSHTCPYAWEYLIKDLFFSDVNQNIIDKSTEKFFDEILKNTTYNRWYFGHFHDNRDLADPEIKATMLFHEALPFGSSYKEELMHAF